jgi:hypothetical protein
MNEPNLQLLADAVGGAPIPSPALNERMAVAREAQERASIKLEDLAREIANDERLLGEKIQRFNKICGEIEDLSVRLEGTAQ